MPDNPDTLGVLVGTTAKGKRTGKSGKRAAKGDTHFSSFISQIAQLFTSIQIQFLPVLIVLLLTNGRFNAGSNERKILGIEYERYGAAS
ncbi:hypothetical protein NTD87_23545 [Pseudomonas sp. 6D_7.1_Bac1]|nr:hypothetical protein [Pseudomonas sp. 6D_7.1_Bac1]MCU1752423.1 hypothetical protein [Pseudomonas sp. 6D_7.1_Bac1]